MKRFSINVGAIIVSCSAALWAGPPASWRQERPGLEPMISAFDPKDHEQMRRRLWLAMAVGRGFAAPLSGITQEAFAVIHHGLPSKRRDEKHDEIVRSVRIADRALKQSDGQGFGEEPEAVIRSFSVLQRLVDGPTELRSLPGSQGQGRLRDEVDRLLEIGMDRWYGQEMPLKKD